MKISQTKTRRQRRGHEELAYLDWTELSTIYTWARMAEDRPGELSEFTQLGYLAKDLRS